VSWWHIEGDVEAPNVAYLEGTCFVFLMAGPHLIKGRFRN
jgi:hypothetical protein